MGIIGSAVAKGAKGFDMHAVYYNRCSKEEKKKKVDGDKDLGLP